MPPQVPIHSNRPKLPPDVLPSGAPRRLLFFALAAFLSSLFVYWSISIGYAGYLDRSLQSLRGEVDTLSLQVTLDQQESLISLYSQVNNINELLESHVYVANIFPILENNTHSQVSYITMDVLVPDRRVAISGIAASYDALVSQLAIFEMEPKIERVVLESSSLVVDVLNFKILLTFTPKVFEFTHSLQNEPKPPIEDQGLMEQIE